jgi:hypothetical protein
MVQDLGRSLSYASEIKVENKDRPLGWSLSGVNRTNLHEKSSTPLREVELFVKVTAWLLVLHEFVDIILMDHHFLVRVLTGFGVLNGLNNFDVVTTGSGVGSTLAYP